MYSPKKLKWNSLTEFRDYLQRETSEKIVSFDGWRLITETTEYGIIDSQLRISPKQKKTIEPKLETLGDRPKKPKVKKKVPEVKPKSKKEILEEMRRRGKAALDKKNKGKR
jgi:hypothetical protein